MAPRHRRGYSQRPGGPRGEDGVLLLPAAHPVARLQLSVLRHRRDVHRHGEWLHRVAHGDGLHDHRRSRRVLPLVQTPVQRGQARQRHELLLVLHRVPRSHRVLYVRVHRADERVFHADVFARGHHVHVGCDGSEQGNGRGVRVRRVPLRPDADRVHKRHSDGVRGVQGWRSHARGGEAAGETGGDQIRRQLSRVSRDPSFGEESRMRRREYYVRKLVMYGARDAFDYSMPKTQQVSRSPLHWRS
mmetsp:Transcript_10119/g.44020  ORF Transcript_10119/g.44020 Transcript_10119/m.44020 type:complete len:245 (-) Transcript_10119:2007-2741(-)